MLAIFMAIFAVGYFGLPRPRWSIYAPDDWERLSAQGVQALQNNDLDRAEDFFDQAQETLKYSSPDNIRRATVLLDLGEVEGHRRHFAKAEELLQASVKIFDANPDRFSPQKVTALEELAIAEVAENKFGQSLNHFEQAIALEQKTNGPNSAYLARILREYAGILLTQGRMQDSLRAVQRATDIDNEKGQNWLSTSNPSTAPAK
jgi:tetratricopeptide (TPR) repeat protein